MAFFKPKKKNPYGWFGDYKSWDSLTAISGGYEAGPILDKTKEALLKVKKGEAVYERDSVLFDKKIYPYSIISALLYTAAECGNQLNVIDFGGSLGSTYYQVRDLIPPAVRMHWSVVEQDNFVRCGKEHFEDDVLKFHFTIGESLAAKKADILLLSSVVQYLEKPHEFLEEIVRQDFSYILIDRTAFIAADRPDRLTLQVVPPDIYEAWYPAWFFNEKRFLEHFQDYDIKLEFESFVQGEQEMEIDHVKAGYDKGFFLIKRQP
ncbi:methyltransferase, TIGR04325 family protein [Dyadobacter beijingensis]|uniref:Methyltransferase, TIGR04325 family protein n=1 Tax=Dyadobacter beijingensis TaxID=365489 RepID=A0ABQ2I071_9BACT|nr:methyltransferase, TIGR04325 family [Dyadobacter beijingensis]GGM95920.1 methyltransferase, TIGR04325 family protein [Dyadobacter beijingensis]